MAKTMIKVIERKTNTAMKAEKIEGGYKVYTLAGEPYKKVTDSTFKKYFKLTGETLQEEEDWDETEESKKASKASKSKKTEKKAEEKKAQKQEKATEEKTKAKKSSKKQEKHVELDDVTRENMVEKIRKIFALSKNNPSENEAIAAAVTAQKLMAKYGINEDEITLEELAESIAENIVELKHNAHLLSWYKNLAVTVARNFRVKSYLDANKDVVFRGFSDDVQIAGEVYKYLYILGNKLASRAYATAKEETGTAKGVYNSFVVGYLTGIEEALGEQCTALMLVVPKAVEEDYQVFSQSLQSKAVKVQGNKSKHYEEGKKEGKAAVKSRGLTDKSKKKGGKK